MKSGRQVITASFLVLASWSFAGAGAQEIVYHPINPSFGGDSFNSSHLLAVANAQNDHTDPRRSETGNTQVDQFLRQLQSRLLSSLAGEVNDAIFGESPRDSGTITFGDQTITFVRGLDSVHLTITDTSTGAITEIEIPLLGQSGSSSAATGVDLLQPASQSPISSFSPNASAETGEAALSAGDLGFNQSGVF
ncbi:MAG: curli assembly protein CsgF [Hyphomonas sp.]